MSKQKKPKTLEQALKIIERRENELASLHARLQGTEQAKKELEKKIQRNEKKLMQIMNKASEALN